MSDRELRELERRYQETGDPQDRARLWGARARALGLHGSLLDTHEALETRGIAWARARAKELLAEPSAPGLLLRLSALAREAFGPSAAKLWANAYERDVAPLEPSLLEARVLSDLCRGEADARAYLELGIEWIACPPSQQPTLGARLAELSAELQGTDDSWYYGIADLLEEFTEAAGEPLLPEEEVESLLQLCFTSWVLREGDAQRFGEGLALLRTRQVYERRYGFPAPELSPATQLPVIPARDAREALLPHLQASAGLDWASPPAWLELPARAWRATGEQERYLASRDLPAHGGDPARERAFRSALDSVRRVAAGAERLTFGTLQEVQGEVLGQSETLRATPALARGGAECYAWFEDLHELLAAKVNADLADACHPVVQAARLYLDLIFCHPFVDGNARAARLGLELVLARARLPTPELEPLVRFEKRAGDAENYWAFAALLARGVASV